ncbi:Meiotic Sister-Chromatid recombination aldehyde dehydrogenase [Zalaria obscura]|uniref:Meiotic Sister-Chromatid recombination aldehyde dehydrogenase n=1 Tax=Zalaria obscura TaxID=2024903 RepID=A0ACC3SEY9_9PEZI
MHILAYHLQLIPLKVLRYILDHQDDIIQAACLDSGKTRVDAVLGEIFVTVEKLKWTINHGEKALRPESRPTNFLMFYKKNEVRWEPLGVVAACVSWKYASPSLPIVAPTDVSPSYPFHNLLGPVISALFTGNAIIVKNSEQTAWSSAFYTSIARGALTACGYSPDLVHSLTCWPQTADHLTSHPRISHITFIGSKPVAHLVAASAAKALTPVCVELGGKDAAVVLDAPDGRETSQGEMNRVVSIIMRGVFQSAGQNCIGIERVVAMPRAYTRIVEMLTPRIKALRVGSALAEDNIDVGAMISDASFSKLESLVADAVKQGATLVCGGSRYQHPKYPQGHYFQPTLLTEVTKEMQIAQEELFAPVCIVLRAESVNDAIAIANSTIYGLGSNVFGPTSSAAAMANLYRVTNEMKAGMVAVNDFAVTYATQLPFGGVKGSGYGRFAGEEGLRGLCNTKAVCVDRWPGWISTSIPGGLDYPMKKGAAEIGKGVVEVGYGESIGRRIGGVRKMIGV